MKIFFKPSLLLMVLFFHFQTLAMNTTQSFWSALVDCINCQNGLTILDEEAREAEFKNSSEDERICYQYSWDKFDRRFREISWGFLKAGTLGGASYYLMSNPNFMTFAGIIGFGFRDKIEASINSVNSALWPSVNIRKLDDLELKLKRSAGNMPVDQAEKLANDISNLRLRLTQESSGHSGYAQQENATTLKELKRLEMVLKLPREAKIIDQKKQEEIFEHIEKSMATYDRELTDGIKLLVYEILNSSNLDSDLSKFAYLFLGLPGTGKTAIAKLISKCAGIQCFIINLSEIEPSDLFATNQFGSQPSSDLKIGKITECFLKDNPSTKVLFFLDEIHDALNGPKASQWQSVLKLLLDPDLAYMRDEGLKADVYLGDTIIIAAANVPSKDKTGAVRNRMMEYIFKPAKADARVEIAHHAFDKALQKFKVSKSEISKEDQKILQEIIDYDLETCLDEGVRPLKKVIRRYAAFLAAKQSGLKIDSQIDIPNQFASARGTSYKSWKKEDK